MTGSGAPLTPGAFALLAGLVAVVALIVVGIVWVLTRNK